MHIQVDPHIVAYRVHVLLNVLGYAIPLAMMSALNHVELHVLVDAVMHVLQLAAMHVLDVQHYAIHHAKQSVKTLPDIHALKLELKR